MTPMVTSAFMMMMNVATLRPSKSISTPIPPMRLSECWVDLVLGMFTVPITIVVLNLIYGWLR